MRQRRALVLAAAGFLVGAAVLASLHGPPAPSLPLAREAHATPAAAPAPLDAAPERPERTLVADATSEDDDEGDAFAEPPPPTPAEIAAWIDDLRDDDVRGNATRAMVELGKAGDLAREALERALSSVDVQQRRCAAAVLRRFPDPSPRLLAATIEELLDDPANVVHWLRRHEARARPHLRNGLGSQSLQQRFYCAVVLACGDGSESLEQVCSTLIQHLRDNTIRGDALMAANALHTLGKAALPHVRAAMPFAEPQAWSLLRLIELDLESPPRCGEEFAARRRLHRVSGVYADPVVQYRWSDEWMPRM